MIGENMKKVFPIIFVLFALSLIIQYVVNFIINDHVVEYSILSNNKSYMVKETFRYENEENFYDFTVTDSEDLFYTFSFNEDFNKQEEVIKDIEFFTTKDLQCIFPIYKRNKTGNVSCIYQGKQVSYSYLEQINNYDISIISKALKDKGYDHLDWNKSEDTEYSIENAPSIKAYKDNILDDYHFILWNYKGPVLLTNDHTTYRMYLSKDQYDNKNSALVGKYYITVEVGEGQFNYFVMYNTKDFGKGIINAEKHLYITRDYYYNGVFKKKLYLTDLVTKKQVEIDPIKETAKEVGNEGNGYLVVKGDKLVNVKAEEFLKEKVYFDNKVEENRLSEIGALDIRLEDSYYYYTTSDGCIYKVNKEKIYSPVLLFKLDGLTEWSVKDGDVMAIAKDTVYFYNEASGLNKIAVNPELNYNHINMVDFYKE